MGAKIAIRQAPSMPTLVRKWLSGWNRLSGVADKLYCLDWVVLLHVGAPIFSGIFRLKGIAAMQRALNATCACSASQLTRALNAPSRQSATFPLAVVAAAKNLHRHRELHCVPNLLFDLREERSHRLMDAGYKSKSSGNTLCLSRRRAAATPFYQA